MISILYLSAEVKKWFFIFDVVYNAAISAARRDAALDVIAFTAAINAFRKDLDAAHFFFIFDVALISLGIMCEGSAAFCMLGVLWKDCSVYGRRVA